MKASRLAGTVRDVARGRRILAVLLRYGFGDLLSRLPLEGPLALGARTLRRSPLRRIVQLSPELRLRRALEELGPTFVKLGQLLAGRADLLPAAITAELEKLRDDVAPMPPGRAEAIVAAELGRPCTESFLEFEPKPLAAASIAQVHGAVLLDGRRVAVKIRREGIDRIVEADLGILRDLAQLARGTVFTDPAIDPVAVVDELSAVLLRELDFRHERRALERFGRLFAGDRGVKVPQPVSELSTVAVLVMERIDGLRPGNRDELLAAGLDPRLLARRGAEAFLTMALDHGRFHADPHGGNLLFCPGNVVAFLDFGAVGRLDQPTREALVDLMVALGRQDVPRVAQLFLRIGRPGDDEIDRAALEDDVGDFVDDYGGRALADIPVPNLLQDFFAILRRHAIRFPSDLVVFARALICLEAEGHRLDPDFHLMDEMRRPVKRLIARRYSLRSRAARLASGADELVDMAFSLPRELRRVLALLEERRLEMRLSHVGLEGLVREIDRASNRIAFALIVAALVVGSAIVSNLRLGPFVAGFPALGVLGFSLAGLLGLWLLLAILRSGKL